MEFKDKIYYICNNFNEYYTEKKILGEGCMGLVKLCIRNKSIAESPLSKCWHDFMRVSPVRPEQYQSVKNRVNSGHHTWHTSGVNFQGTSITLKCKIKL